MYNIEKANINQHKKNSLSEESHLKVIGLSQII